MTICDNYDVFSSKDKSHTNNTHQMSELFTNKNPVELFKIWMTEASAHEANDPDAAALATVSADGQPNVRMVLVKQVDEKGFTFFTNSESQKGQEIAAIPKAALCFHWKSQLRQIRVRGDVEKADNDVSDAYFASRHPVSRRGAIMSQQSRPLTSRQDMEVQLMDITARYPDDDHIPRPDHWHGYRIIPKDIEFWQQGDNRLHNRILFTRQPNGEWSSSLLYP